MSIQITFTGRYRNDNWQTTEIEVADDEGQTAKITLDTDGTYCIETSLIGDDKPEFSGGHDFQTVWLGVAEHFGIFEP